MLAVVALLLMFLVVVGLHEIGHALVARCFGVKIESIAIGFGKALFCLKDKRRLKWVIGILPLGGYVQLLNSRNQPVQENQSSQCFDKKTAWIRCLILLAGGFFNFLLALFAMTAVMAVGYSQYPPVVAKVIPQSLMARAGVNSGDRLVAINAQKVDSWQKAGMQFITELGHANVRLEVTNTHLQTRILTINLQDKQFLRYQYSFFNQLGITPKIGPQYLEKIPPKPFFSAVAHALSEVGSWVLFYLLMIKQLITGMLPISVLLGPLGLFAASIASFAQGFSSFMFFLATLSLAVGVVNYLPIPGLDGGSLFYIMLEKIRGKSLSVAMELLLYRLARIAFFMLMVQLVLNDGVRYFMH